MSKKVKKELSLILIITFVAALLTGCSDITKININESGAGSYEETITIAKKIWDSLIADVGNDDIILSYFRTLYPQAQVEISDQTIDGTSSKIMTIRMKFKDISDFTQILSSLNMLSVKFNSCYFSRSPIYMPLEEDNLEQGNSPIDELQTLIGADEELTSILTKELKNINITTAITFPYTVTDTNGIIGEDGKTVVWDAQKTEDAERIYALFHVSNSLKSPTYTGASNGKNYNTGVTVNIDSENLLKEVSINNKKTESDYLFLFSEGVYNITASDINGNRSKLKFRIDTTKPSVTGVANGKTYKSTRTIKFSDKGSGVKNAVLNGKTIKTGKKVTKKGAYTLVITDKAGNKKTVKFKLK